MSIESRRGAFKSRSKYQSRKPDLGYYMIITNTKETEKNYFEGLRDSLCEEYKNRIVIKVFKTETKNLVQRAIELRDEDPQY